MDPVVCCVKWGTKYPARYANALHGMVQRNLGSPHDFVCLTDDPSGLDKAILPVPLPDELHGYWNKISLFKRGVFELGRTIVYLDLDVVVVGPLDFLLEDLGGFRIARHLGVKGGFNSSVMRFQADQHANIYESFIDRAGEIVTSGRYVGDQDWIYEQVRDATFFRAGKIVSYKKDLNSHVFPFAKKAGLKFHWIRAPAWMTVSPPQGASIVVFHGKPDPEDVMDRPYGPWKRAPFVKENWW